MTTAATAVVGAEGDFTRAKTAVLWDIENCEVPKGWDANMIAKNVSTALLKMNYSGPVSITAYGDTNLIPRHVQQALSSTGVALHHVPAGVKDASDKKILVDMLLWAIDNPAPANIMLISGDRDFSNALHQLSMRRYTILLAQPPRASAPLVSAAKYVWLWTSLASGGPPLTSAESPSGLLNNGQFHVSTNEVSKCPVSEQVQSSKPTDSSSDVLYTKDRKTDENIAPRGLPQEMRRNMLQNGNGATTESVNICRTCNVVCDSFEKLMAHTSDQRHRSQVALMLKDHRTRKNSVPRGLPQETRRNLAQTSVSAKPVQEPELVEPVWCELCQISCTSKDAYKYHTYGKRHRNNLELQLGKSKDISVGLVEPPKEVLEKQKNKIKKASDSRANTNADYVCRLCNVTCQSQIVFDSHLKGQKHSANVSQAEALSDSKKLEEKVVGEKDQPRETVVEPQLQSQDAQENTTEKYVAIVNQSEVLMGSNNFQEKGVGEMDHPRETIAKPKPNIDYVCRLCNVRCHSQIVFDSHLRGKKHTANASQSQALFDYICRLCNVTCHSQSVFDSHLKGKKHTANVSQLEELNNSEKLQEKGVREKDQPNETVAEPLSQSQNAQKTTKCFEKHVMMVNQQEALNDSKQLREKGVGEALAEAQFQSQNFQENSKCFEKHVDMVNQSEALINSRKLEENGFCGKALPIETIAEPPSQSQNTGEHTKFLQKQRQELSEICGNSENSVKETIPSTKDRVETVPNGNKFLGDLRYDFEVPIETRECFDGIVKPVNLAKGAIEHSGDVKTKQKEVAACRGLVAASRLCHLCVVIGDSQGLLKVVCDNKNHKRTITKTAFLVSEDGPRSSVSTKPVKEPEDLQPVWCDVCQMSCKSKAAYANHTYGKNHRQKLELLSAKNENMSKIPATENAEKTKKALVDSMGTRQECGQGKPKETLEQEVIFDSRKINEESDQDNTATEEVNEINTIFENLEQRVFTGETRIPKETRGILDVVSDRELPPNVNVTEKLEDKSQYKPEPKPLEPENKPAGSKENPGEVPKTEETKGQVDSFWTFLWGKKS